MEASKKKHKTTIGGQALIEGVMMKGPSKVSIAVRKPDNGIDLKLDDVNSVTKKHKILSLPFIRGVVGLVEALVIGTNALMHSAEFYEEEEVEEDSKEGLIERVFKDKAEDVTMFFTIAFSLGLSILIFMILPNILTSVFKVWIDNSIYLNLIEGVIRVSIFLCM